MVSKQSQIVTDIKLSRKTRYGYGVASIADSIILDFVSAFFLFFLANVVGINPALAGSISLIAIIWDAISDPIIGNLADRSKHNHGKYRRFILISVVPIFIASILMFLKVNFGPTGTYIYFVLIAILYYTAYTVFNIPYMALGSSLTSNEAEKTKLSAARQSFGFIGMLFAGAVPSILIEILRSMGIADEFSYTITAVILAICSVVTILITWSSTKGSELSFDRQIPQKGEFRKTMLSIFKCKPYLLLIVSALLFFFGFTMIGGSVMFVITGVLGLTEGDAGIIFVVLSLSGVAISFLMAKLSEKIDKKTVYIVMVLGSAICMIATRFIGIKSLGFFAAYIVVINFGISAFLVFVFNFLYDVVDIINFKTGSRDGGAIFSYYSFIVKIGKAGAVQLIGILLASGGYDGSLAIQNELGSKAILNIITVYPAIFFIMSAIIICFYPVTKKRILSLQAEMIKKNNGEAYNTEVFKKLL